jgi:catechol 2,3-dioxygenase-like lactoylglutathione lyase family enzyme
MKPASAKLLAVHPVLAARDVNESVRFFRCLGFDLSFQDDPVNPRYAGVTRDGVEVHLQWADADQFAYPTDRGVFRFVVDDVDRLYSEWADSGVAGPTTSQESPWSKPGDTPWGTREFHLRDPAGSSLQFYSSRSTAR